MKVMSMIFTSMAISSILMTIMILLNPKWENNKMESANFECGFNKKQMASIPFSTKFFAIAVLFLIFDLEISLFLPVFFPESATTNLIMCSSSLMLALTAALIMEWKSGLIQWSK